MRNRSTLALVAGLLGAATANGQFVGYTVIDREMWTVELPSGRATAVGPTGARIDALAFSPAGLYGVDLERGQLRVLNSHTGKAFRLVAWDLGDWDFVYEPLTDLAFDGARRPWLVARYRPGINLAGRVGLFSIDRERSRSAASLVADTGFDWTGLASSAGLLLAISNQNDLVVIDETSGAIAQVIGGPSLPQGTVLHGLDTDPSGRLWALWSTSCILGAPCPTSFGLTEIEPQTGRMLRTIDTDLPARSTAGPFPGGLAIDVRRGVPCSLANRPAATLLLPYFEIDVEDPGGRDTLFSVGTISSTPTLAHAVLWTNWGVPVLSFDFFVPADGIRSFRVSDLVRGRLPQTSPPAPADMSFENCTDPLVLPELDTEALVAVLAGLADPTDGLCRSSGVEDGRLATGYVTVDVVRDCSGGELVTPLDDGYFLEGGTGLATNDNLLWGDFYLVDPANDFAHGERLVGSIADDTWFGGPSLCDSLPCPHRIATTFYDRVEGNRMPLASSYRARHLSGGGFDGRTDLVIWQPGSPRPVECGLPLRSSTRFQLEAHFLNQNGELTYADSVLGRETALRVPIPGEDLPVVNGFGSVDLRAWAIHGVGAIQDIEAQQLWVMPLVGAEGRFGVGTTAVPISDFCR